VATSRLKWRWRICTAAATVWKAIKPGFCWYVPKRSIEARQMLEQIAEQGCE
jgi:hypothetical protein